MSDLAAAFFSETKFAPVRPLTADLLPGIPRTDLAAAIVGELMRRVPLLCRTHRCQLAYYQVAMIMLGHSGYHSNRVWCSQLHIAQKAIEMFAWKGTPESVLKTVQRAIDFWCVKFPIFRKITDQEELLSGPGEWQFVDSGKKKRGKNQTNHYDTKDVAPFAPTNYAGALDALITGEQYKPAPTPEPMPPIDVDERYPYPFSDDEPAESRHAARQRAPRPIRTSEERAIAIQQGNDELTEAGFDDPFAEAPVTAKNTLLTVEPPSFEGLPVFDKKDISNISPIPRNGEMSDKYDEASRQEKSATGLVACNCFPETNLSGLTIKYGVPAHSPAPIPAQVPPGPPVRKANPANYPPEVATLVQRGVDEGMAVTMFTTMKVVRGGRQEARRWLRQLLAYGDYRNAFDNTTYGGGWYNVTFQNWRDRKAKSWPDEAMDVIGRAEAAYNKSAEGRGFVQHNPPAAPQTPRRPADALLEFPSPLLPEFDSFLTYKPASETQAVPPILPPPIPVDAPPELLATWPVVRKGAQDILTPGINALVGKLTPVGLQTGATGTIITLGTAMPFAKKTFDDKPQQVGMLARLFADALGLDAKAVTVQIVVLNTAMDGAVKGAEKKE